LRTTATALTLTVLVCFGGCTSFAKKAAKKGYILTVDFTKGQSLEYKFFSTRQITIDWDPEKKMSRPGKQAVDRSTESLEVVMTYTPVEVDPYGLTTIKATCKSARVSRSKRPGGLATRDAAEHFAGKSFNLKVGPTGKIEDYSELDQLIKQVGEKAFRPDTSSGRIKDPDMIGDFIATQWFLWDSVASIDPGAGGLAVGQTWNSQLSIPAPMVMRKARDVVYKLEEIRDTPAGSLAVISSSYTPAQSVPIGWPIPYSGRFQVSGTFGFLGAYRLLSLQGTGEELFNIDAGRLEQYTQEYEMKIQAAIPLGIGAKPVITVKQTITASRL